MIPGSQPHSKSLKRRLPSSIYEQREASGELKRDTSQCLILPILDRISLHITPPPSGISRLFTTSSTHQGLYLWGGVGRGKTLLMDCLVSAIPCDWVLRTHFHEFMLTMHRNLAQTHNTKNPLSFVVKRFMSGKKLLALDEFEVLDIGDAMLLSGILENLKKLKITVITTSNTHPADLYTGGLQRQRFLPAIAMIQSEMEVIRMADGMDHRLQYLRDQQRFITPPGDGADAQLTEIFHHLLSGEDFACGGHMLLHERIIPTRLKAEGVTWFDFSSLCEGPRSSMDYLALAKTHHTIIVSNIPLMTKNQDNQAKRFISLIDVLYDNRTNFIASAYGQIRDLYEGERLSKEFGRTTSRLIEMQSDHYIAQR